MIQKRRSSGFTMLELAIVIVIIAIITGIGFTTTLGVLDAANRSSTQSKLDTIEASLQAFLIKNNRLPCPTDITETPSDSTYNVESTALGTCTSSPAAELIGSHAVRGGVPVATLGLADTFMYDSWGRKIVYVVDRNTTYEQAFDAIDVDEFCEIEIEDVSGTIVTGDTNYTGGAAYSLLSYGENGHGGYTEFGTLVSSGSADADEQQNCRCDAAAAAVGGLDVKFIQQESTATYDDIVRYKELWQMETAVRDPEAVAYNGPEMVISISHWGRNRSRLYEKQCGRWEPFTGTLPNEIISGVRTLGIAFLHDNTQMFFYQDPSCYQYSMSKAAVGPAPLAGTGLSCPAYNASPETSVSMSENGYLAITKAASPYIDVWKLNGIYAYSFNSTAPAVALTPALSSMPSKVVLSSNGNYLVVTRNVATTYTYVYARTGPRTYTRLTDPPSTPDPAGAIAFSRDENFLAMAVNSSFDVRVWSINKITNAFTLETTLSDGTATTSVLKFSPDGRYMVMAGGGPVNTDNYNTKIYLYKVDGTTFTDIAPTGSFTYDGTAFTDAAFSTKSNFLILPFTDHVADKRAMVFRRTAVDTFEFQTDIEFFLKVQEDAIDIKFRN